TRRGDPCLHVRVRIRRVKGSAKPVVDLISRLKPSVVVVVHAGGIAVPPVRTASDRRLGAQPPAAAIAIGAVVAGPPTDPNANEAVVEVMAVVVMDEMVVVVTVPVVAVPIIAVPRGAT